MIEQRIALEAAWSVQYAPTPQADAAAEAAWQPLPTYKALTGAGWLRRTIAITPQASCVNYILRLWPPAGAVVVEVNQERLYNAVTDGAPLELNITYHVALGDNTLTLWVAGAPEDIALCIIPCG